MPDEWIYKIKRGTKIPRYMAYVHRARGGNGVSTIPSGYSGAFFTRRGAMRWIKRVIKHAQPDILVAEGQMTGKARHA